MRRLIDILIGEGNGIFVNQINLANKTFFAPILFAHGDLNNDQRSEIVVAYEDSHDIDILVLYDMGIFINETSYSTGVFPRSLTFADLNNDSQLDIIVANQNSYDISILLGYENGSFANQIRYSTGLYSHAVTIGHLNDDRYLLLVRLMILSVFYLDMKMGLFQIQLFV